MAFVGRRHRAELSRELDKVRGEAPGRLHHFYARVGPLAPPDLDDPSLSQDDDVAHFNSAGVVQRAMLCRQAGCVAVRAASSV
jgi:hypothetical protein